MTEGKRMENMKRYVEDVCLKFLDPHRDVKCIEYRHQSNHHEDGGSDYIKLSTTLGFSKYYDITGLDKGQVCVLICSIIVNGEPRVEIRDTEAIREVEALFSN